MPARDLPPPEPPGLAEVAARVRSCTRCGLCATRTHAVPGEGQGGMGLMLVGEAPGRREDETGRPFAGAAGRNLDLALAEAGIARPDCFVTSIVKCRPPGNRDPTPLEKATCRPYLLEQVRLLRPRVVVALGRHALSGLVGDGRREADFVGQVGRFLPGPEGISVWVSLHPAAVIYRATWKGEYLRRWREFGVWYRSGAPPPLQAVGTVGSPSSPSPP